MMKFRLRSAVRYLVAALSALSMSVGAADVASSVSTASADDSTDFFLTDFLTLEWILPVGIVVLALVIIARKRKVH